VRTTRGGQLDVRRGEEQGPQPLTEWLVDVQSLDYGRFTLAICIINLPHMTSIHPTAIVGPECQIAPDAVIGPYCVLEGTVKLGSGVRLVGHVMLKGPVTIGARTMLYPGVCIGLEPQDLKFKPGDTTPGVTVGEDCLIREHVTIHGATKDVATHIGNRVFMMACSHVGHDGWIGNNVTIVNNALVAGHVKVFDNATLSGNCAVHQFCRIGRMAFVSGLCAMAMELPPFCVGAHRNLITGVNLIGMRRAGYAREDITAVRNAYWHVLRRMLPKGDLVAELEARGKDSALVAEMAEFVRTAKRPVARGAKHASLGDELDFT
jgi:UDP-N-acetylglucosamine acyltransferase